MDDQEMCQHCAVGFNSPPTLHLCGDTVITCSFPFAALDRGLRQAAASDVNGLRGSIPRPRAIKNERWHTV